MKTIAKGLLTIALFAAAACDGSPTASNALVSPAEASMAAQAPGVLVFTSTQSQTEETPQTATGGVGSINFTGSVLTGTPCYTVTGSHSGRRNDITLTVTASSTGGFCTQIITYNNYQGSISGLTAGTYNFTVVHNVNGTRTTAYNSTVVVQ